MYVATYTCTHTYVGYRMHIYSSGSVCMHKRCLPFSGSDSGTQEIPPLCLGKTDV